jgi:hypothetical protein
VVVRTAGLLVTSRGPLSEAPPRKKTSTTLLDNTSLSHVCVVQRRLLSGGEDRRSAGDSPRALEAPKAKSLKFFDDFTRQGSTWAQPPHLKRPDQLVAPNTQAKAVSRARREGLGQGAWVGVGAHACHMGRLVSN